MKPEKRSANPVRVLLMEDEPAIAQLIRLHLQHRGFTVEIAADGDEGLALYDKTKHDILLLDQRMPGRTGLEVLKELGRRGPLPPAIVVSGLGLDSVAVEALKLGAMDYVVKDPGSGFLENLPVVITEALRKHRAQANLRTAGEERGVWMNELQQRVRELGCLYGIEKLLAAEGDSMDVALQSVVNIIPGASRRPDACWARVRVANKTFPSADFLETEWKRVFELRVGDKKVGAMEVGYREPPGVPDGELFSPEELDLLQSVADRLAHFLDKWQTEHELHRTHAELRKLHLAVEQSASAVMITDAKGVIEYVNPQFTGMTGYSRDEVIGLTPRILKSGMRSPAEYAELWRVLRAGRQWRGEFHNRRKDGSLYWDYSTISPIINDVGQVTHFVAVKEDITSDKEAEELREAVLQLSARIAGCETEDDICRVTVEGIRELMHVDRSGLFLGNPNDPAFHGTYGTDMQGRTTDEHHHAWDIKGERDVVDLFASVPYKTGFPLGAPDPQPGEENLFSTLIALRQSGTVFGVISIDNRMSRRDVSVNQMEHIALLAEVIGNALQVARAREALRMSVDSARQANDELEAFNRAMVGRENRVIELKEEVNRLLAEQGKPARYPPVWNGESESAPRRKKADRA